VELFHLLLHAGSSRRFPKTTTPEEEPVSMSEAARQLGVTPSTVYRWINDGLVPAEQLTPGAPWRIRMTDRIRALIAQDAPDGWVPVQVATRALGISRPTLLQRVKRGELRAVHIRAGRKKSLRIELPTPRTACSSPSPTVKEQCDDRSIMMVQSLHEADGAIELVRPA
jgi:excisionase family DNA binding protein